MDQVTRDRIWSLHRDHGVQVPALIKRFSHLNIHRNTLSDFIRQQRLEAGMVPLRQKRGSEFASEEIHRNKSLNSGHHWRSPNPNYY